MSLNEFSWIIQVNLSFHWSNRNPNEPQEEKLRVSKERNRFKTVAWEPYDKKQRKYLEIGGSLDLPTVFSPYGVGNLNRLLGNLEMQGKLSWGTNSPSVRL